MHGTNVKIKIFDSIYIYIKEICIIKRNLRERGPGHEFE